MTMMLTCENCAEITSWKPATNLNAYMTIYQMGLLKINIEDTSSNLKRFKVSDYGMGVEWS
jgi:hypothetical protein